MAKSIMNTVPSAPLVSKKVVATAKSASSAPKQVAKKSVGKVSAKVGKVSAKVGKGRGSAVTKKPVKSARALRMEVSPAVGISGQRLRTLAIQRGLIGFSRDAVERIRSLLDEAMGRTLAAAMLYTESGRRKTVSGMDVQLAYTQLNSQPCTIYVSSLPNKHEDTRSSQKKVVQTTVTHHRAKNQQREKEFPEFEA